VDSGSKLAMLRSLGADHVIDYTQEDFTDNDETYDVIFDVVGGGSYARIMRSLSEHGCYLLANPTPSKMVRGRWTSWRSNKRVFFEPAHHEQSDLLFLKHLCESGALKPVIDRRFTLEEVPEAHRYVETGQKAGNVVIVVRKNEPL
jgi:NADPH:quinone reductase-like Zn-dependent oxidoreductase